MNTETDKVTSLKEAIARYVSDGAHISIGGFTINRNPMAAVYEIIRQKKRNLHLYAHSNGQGVDELVGGGCVAKLEIAYGGSGRFAPTCIRFRKAVENKSIAVEDYSNYQMTLRFLAGAMGVPFLPTRSSLGSDIVDRWGFPQGQGQLEPPVAYDIAVRSHAAGGRAMRAVAEDPVEKKGDAVGDGWAGEVTRCEDLKLQMVAEVDLRGAAPQLFDHGLAHGGNCVNAGHFRRPSVCRSFGA